MEELENGVNESEPAEQTESVSETPEEGTEGATEGNTEGNESVTEEAQPELDRNAIYADARRKAESEARRKQAAIDAQFADRFKGFTNPKTGQPITSAQDYFDALAAQEELATKQELADKGIDPNIIENAVNNSPAIKAANALLAEQRLKDVRTYLDKQIAEIGKIDPDIKSAADIERSERYPEVLRYVNENHLSVVDAYKLVYADKLSERHTAAVKQQAINNAKSQSHLTATDGGTSNGDDLVDIPSNAVNRWKEWFPDKTMKELRVLYNNSLH